MSARTAGSEGFGAALRRRIPLAGTYAWSIFADDVVEPPGTARDVSGSIAARNGSNHLDGRSETSATTFPDQNRGRSGGPACPPADIDGQGKRIARAGCSNLEKHAPEG